MMVGSTFDFDNDLRRIGLAQALRALDRHQADDRVARLFAYAAAGVGPVGDADDRDALRRHGARLRAFGASAVAVPA